jgi:cyclophilin family peptidyl-prolyl cis-trans isomerase
MLVLAACLANADELPPGIYAEFRTPRGVMVAELYANAAPLMVANFVGLAEGSLPDGSGESFYRQIKFHRVVPGFVVQAGDPTGTGSGGPDYVLPDEFPPGLSHDATGVLSMANDGPNTNGSQFFITLAPAPRLDFLYSPFGRVIRGLEVLPKIEQGDAVEVKVRRVGAEARRFYIDRPRLEAMAKERLPSAQVPGQPMHLEDPLHVLPSDPPRAKHFSQKLQNLERATGWKIYVRLYLTGAEDVSDESPLGIAKRLGLGGDALLAVYHARDRSWRWWMGPAFEEKLARVLGSPREVRETIERTAQSQGGGPTKGDSEDPSEIAKRDVDAFLNRLIPVLLSRRAGEEHTYP